MDWLRKILEDFKDDETLTRLTKNCEKAFCLFSFSCRYHP